MQQQPIKENMFKSFVNRQFTDEEAVKNYTAGINHSATNSSSGKYPEVMTGNVVLKPDSRGKFSRENTRGYYEDANGNPINKLGSYSRSSNQNKKPNQVGSR